MNGRGPLDPKTATPGQIIRWQNQDPDPLMVRQNRTLRRAQVSRERMHVVELETLMRKHLKNIVPQILERYRPTVPGLKQTAVPSSIMNALQQDLHNACRILGENDPDVDRARQMIQAAHDRLMTPAKAGAVH